MSKKEEPSIKNDEEDDIENESKFDAKRPKLTSNDEMFKMNDQEPIESIDEADEDDLTDNIDLIENDTRLCKRRYTLFYSFPQMLKKNNNESWLNSL